jgi:hypothetical protein
MPLQTIKGSTDAAIISLGGCDTPYTLGAVFDVIVEAIATDDWEAIGRLPEFPSVVPESNWAWALADAIELKPNLFGLGVNFNKILEVIGQRIVQARRSR